METTETTESSDSPTKTVGVVVTAALWTRVRMRAAAMDLTIQAWVERTLRGAVERQEKAEREGQDLKAAAREVVGSREKTERAAVVGRRSTNSSAVSHEAPSVARGTSDPQPDAWGTLCGRCGHPKRAHLDKKGVMGHCTFGTDGPGHCRGFVEAEGQP